MELKLKILNRFGVSHVLGNPDDIEVHFPYENSDSLVKRKSYGSVEILDDKQGEILVKISDFEIQGMPVGEKLNFIVRLKSGTKIKEALFTRCFGVSTIEREGEIRKVMYLHETRNKDV
jgi:hypothetical protein